MGTLIVDSIKKRDGSDGTNVGTGASISSPGANILTLGTNNTEKFRVDGTGHFGFNVGTGNGYTAQFNDTGGSATLQITNATVGSGAGDGSRITASTSGILYIENQENNDIHFYTNGAEKVRIAASGQIGLGGANYGNAGQVITSNGSGSAPTWQDAASGITYGSVVNADIAVRARNGGADLGGHSSGSAKWVKMGTSCHIWGYVSTSAGSNPNTDLAVLAFDDTNIPACTSTAGAPFGLCVGTVNFNAQGNFSNVVGAYAQARSISYPREFQLFVETQAGATLETVTKYCAVEDIGTCAFNFDLWYECAA